MLEFMNQCCSFEHTVAIYRTTKSFVINLIKFYALLVVTEYVTRKESWGANSCQGSLGSPYCTSIQIVIVENLGFLHPEYDMDLDQNLIYPSFGHTHTPKNHKDQFISFGVIVNKTDKQTNTTPVITYLVGCNCTVNIMADLWV